MSPKNANQDRVTLGKSPPNLLLPLLRTIDQRLRWIRENYSPEDQIVMLELVIHYCDFHKRRLQRKLRGVRKR